MRALYVASDQPGAGKTAMCVALADELRQRGKRANVYKPLAVIPDGGHDADVEVYQRLLGQQREEWPLALSDQGVAAGVLDEVKATYKRVSGKQDTLFIEGASEIPDEVSAQVVEALDARVLMVCRFRTGLNGASTGRWRGLFGERLLGCIVNGLTRYRGSEARQVLEPALASAGLKVYGTVPEDRRLLGVTVDKLISMLGGRLVVGDGSGDNLVEHFLVGGMGLDPGDHYFGIRESKAVIVRGDRPDIQMAALQTPTACMLLTGGVEPIEYVTYEAERKKVPVVVVETDTLGTMAALDDVVKKARFDHPEKLRRFKDLLHEHVDLGSLLDGLALSA